MQEGSLYDTYVDWYPLLDPRDDHEEECADFLGHFAAALPDGPADLLELGGGAGNNATFMKTRFSCTVTDLSPQMLALSKEANPQCDHLVADMRTLRLDRTFDAVLIHDAISHITTREGVLEALQTAFVHTRPGGVALIVPDCVKESFVESNDADASEGDGLGMQFTMRCWDPDPSDDIFITDYAFLLRDGGGVHAVHMRHEEGMFSVDTWRELIEAAGFEAEAVARQLPEDAHDGPYWNRMWLCRRP